MHAIALGLILVGALIALFYGIKLIILAFNTSILWGLCYLFVPFASLAFVALHWDDAKSPFLRSLLAIPLCVGGVFLAGLGGDTSAL